jgi:integrase
MPDGAATLLSQSDWDKLLEAVDRSPSPFRDRALLCLFWYFGPTVRQVLRLEVSDINFLTGRLRWSPSGPETPLPGDALHALTAYVSFERDPRCPRLFSGRRGRPMTTAQLNAFFRRLQQVSGLPVTPRSLRTAALYRLLQAQPARAMALVFRRRAHHRQAARAGGEAPPAS